MTTATQIYQRLKALGAKQQRLHEHFAHIRSCADILAQPASEMPGLTVASASEMEFEVRYCGSLVRFALSLALSTDGSPIGVVDCFRRIGNAGSWDIVPFRTISFKPNGEVLLAKPVDLPDQLYVGDNVSSVFLVASTVYLALHRE